MQKVNVEFLRHQLRKAHTEIKYLKEQLNKANQKEEAIDWCDRLTSQEIHVPKTSPRDAWEEYKKANIHRIKYKTELSNDL